MEESKEQREAFEEWLKSFAGVKASVKRDKKGRYKDTGTELLFISWVNGWASSTVKRNEESGKVES